MHSLKRVKDRVESSVISPVKRAKASKLLKQAAELHSTPDGKPGVASKLSEIEGLIATDPPKLKFLSAFRLFRRWIAPRIKAEYPNLTGKERQSVIRQIWKDTPADRKLVFVMQSRLEEEKARFNAKAQLIKESVSPHKTE